MILHVADLLPGGRVFWVESRFDEKDAVKAAGFIWHAATGCRPSCGACAGGLGKVWWTRHDEAARRLAADADDDARVALGMVVAPPVAPTKRARVRSQDTPALLGQVLDEPDNLAAKHVYADWLLDRGDPRGEFIRVQCERELATGERHAELVKIERRLLRKHQSTWLGPIPKMLTWRWRHGFLYAITTNERGWLDGAEGLVAHEPVRRVRIKGVRNLPFLAGSPEFAHIAALSLPDDRITASSLRRLLASPHLANLRGLDLDSNAIGDDGLRVLADTPFPALVELRLFGCAFGPHGGSITSAGLERLLAAPFIPRLRELDLRANTLFLDEVDPDGKNAGLIGRAPLAEGMMLDLGHNHVDAKVIKQLIASPLPSLRLDASHNFLPAKTLAPLATRFTLVERERSSTGELADDSALDASVAPVAPQRRRKG